MADTITTDADDVTAMLLALVTIAQESSDADIVRLALIALYETDLGRQFMTTNPIEVQ
ncbi:hypothetical protein SEA_AXYM_54 [Gordonia phage Axym]|uniref:Uncharacterized protein n=5 Tax=Emalynvirus cozz TaxID=2560490 RepID=A0A4Y5NZ96_9CAUD|nr:hypothetical protein BH767_gp53 [Gordonia phage Cozz]AZS11809.1 hypothetical protein PBI_NINA_55 [Gordonia phage Nina]QCW22387.1 hypothetical protein SEA_AGATHA_55 [Gordonia phage Agatha]QDM56333.1 hypothetical protein SEA_SWEATNTEARS_57 [Gordonia phage SweatNTears]QGH75921.1 hypothetical protein SEA_AXYM_54 [Gordonia phage Axym]QGH76683.1 hypothetical protein PBI_QUASAR_55 [Gordonia phage Quasar]QOP65313.1 hypothetical protein SEA_BURNSEY_55 [Gordonia phage Burnsey]